MTHRSGLRALFAALLIGCTTEASLAPLRVAERGANASVSGQALPPCTVYWSNGVSGNWDDASKWSTGVVPDFNDSACLNASGTYTVTLPYSVTVKAVKVGIGGSNATLLAKPASISEWLLPSDGVYVGPTGTLSVDGCGLNVIMDVGGTFTVDGSLLVDNTTTCGAGGLNVHADTVENNGTMRLSVMTQFDLYNDGYFKNTGSIQANVTTSYVTAFDPSTAKIAAGSITGSGYLSFGAVQEQLRFEWSGGQIADRTGSPGEPLVLVDADTMTFGNTLLNGYVKLRRVSSGTTLVRGHIGPSLHVIADACNGDTYDFRHGGGGPTIVNGELTVASDVWCGPGNTVSGFGFINNGTLAFTNQNNRVLQVTVDSIINNGTMSVQDSVEYQSTGGILRNNSAITVDPSSTLMIGSNATMIAMAGSTQTGKLTLTGALAGTGTVGNVDARSGLILPGPLAGSNTGRLTMNALALDVTSSLEFEVAGPGPSQHDGIDIATNVTYGGGGISLVFQGGYVGGTCGDVVPLMIDHSTAPRGTFGKLGGFNPQPGAWWRTYTTTGEMGIAGYNPVSAVTVTASTLALAEGGPGKSYNMCVGHAPLATVSVAVTDTLPGQLALTNTPVVFTTTAWELPQVVTVAAVDDALIEPPLSDRLTHTITSADGSFNGKPVTSTALTIADNDGSTDLALTITSNPGPIPLGSNFTVSFKVTNNGPTLSTGASFVVPAVAGLTFVSSSGVSCTTKAGVGLVCLVPGTTSAGTALFSITGKGVATGVWAVTMQLNAQQADPVGANNTLVKNLTVN